jgi:hypothetical protein
MSLEEIETYALLPYMYMRSMLLVHLEYVDALFGAG